MSKVIGPLNSTFASGKFGSIIYARNQHGMYAKPTPTVTDPATVDQVTWRDALTTLQTYWKDDGVINQSLKEMWYQFAENWPINHKWGRQIMGNGRDWFIKLNIFRIIAGQGIHNSPPKVPSATYFSQVTLTQGFLGIYCNSSPAPTGDEFNYVSYVPDQSTARRFMPNKTQLLTLHTSADPASKLVIDNADLPTTLSRFFIRWRCIDYYGVPSTFSINYFDFVRL